MKYFIICCTVMYRNKSFHPYEQREVDFTVCVESVFINRKKIEQDIFSMLKLEGYSDKTFILKNITPLTKEEYDFYISN